MSEDADGGLRLRHDRWDVVALSQLPKRSACPTAPFAPDLKNLSRAILFPQGVNVEVGRGDDRERMNSLRSSLHWRR